METHKLDMERLDKSQRAALKRCVGAPLSMADGRALAAFYAIRPFSLPKWQEGRCFAVACAACLWPEEGEAAALPLEACIRQLMAQYEGEGMRRRLISIMDTEWSDDDGLLSVKLSRIMRMLRAKLSARPDFGLLLEDLIHWNDHNRRVQRKWASALFGMNDSEHEHGAQNTKEAATDAI